jgi:hypothetical protein
MRDIIYNTVITSSIYMVFQKYTNRRPDILQGWVNPFHQLNRVNNNLVQKERRKNEEEEEEGDEVEDHDTVLLAENNK